ncbi:ER membrane protein complex subunit 1 [Fasciola hepatica]|uniref:ER membrane protein complex subunit 1 n=1 Tax=Fasciola hepatica TaxID=6192 RepID=A0A4E0R0W4_FASHE|nr:ER membrane protein complex subunit 1 [Fasciola hepatica]
MTQELMEEGVHPYAPVLPLSDQAVISYNQTVLGLRANRTALTGLESTSLVFAYGLDLFFTRIAPSMTYDLLKEDFDYTAIVTVTLGMIVASAVTQRLAARRVVLRAWS